MKKEKNMIEKVMRHHKMLVKIAWMDRGDPDYRCEIRRSLGILKSIKVNGGVLPPPMPMGWRG